MTHASLFSGIGGPEVAAAMLGWDNAFHCEINPFGRAVLEYWFPNSVSYEDITKTDFREWRGKVDVLTGGFPCQPFSYAGHRGGATDSRYLWPEMLRVIDEIRPAWVIGENVAGITTMVEGGLLTDVGCHPSLFGEGDDVHEYVQRETFTIERICSDLERVGYSVQPVLIPAAAVGAPHRRDRVFFIAYDSHRGVEMRGAGEDESESESEGLPERDTIQRAGVAAYVRSEVRGLTTDTDGNRRDEVHEHLQPRQPNGPESLCSGGERTPSDTHSHGHPAQAESEGTEGYGGGDHGESKERSEQAQRLERFYQFLRCAGEGEVGERWADFPTVSPVHRGNDGLPFPLDDLTIPPTRWRTESLKAYGNAIVPQVMFEIFRAIEMTER